MNKVEQSCQAEVKCSLGDKNDSVELYECEYLVMLN